jgi:hypothetical protein
MLTVTPAASAAVCAILDSPDVPDGAGLRLQEGQDAQGRPSIGIAVVSEADLSDIHIEIDRGHELLVAEGLVEVLDEQTLDAQIGDETVAFQIVPASTNGEPPPAAI